jgi:hypothetical protein
MKATATAKPQSRLRALPSLPRPGIGRVRLVKTGPPSKFVLALAAVPVIALWLIPSLLNPKGAFVIAFLWLTAYSIIAPFVADNATHFVKAVLLATVGWFAAFLGLMMAAAIISGRGPGEDAMVFLFPFMLFPALMVLVGVVRVLRQALRRSKAG